MFQTCGSLSLVLVCEIMLNSAACFMQSGIATIFFFLRIVYKTILFSCLCRHVSMFQFLIARVNTYPEYLFFFFMCTFLSWTESFVDYSCPRRSDIKKLVAGVRCHNNFLYNCRPPLAELAHTSGKCMTLSDCRFCHKRSVPHCRITRCIVVSVMACEEHCTSEEASILGSWNSCGVVVQDMQ